MNESSGSSGSTSKIRRVIDEIAFQGNLLALSAAVVPSRPGQEAAGFADAARAIQNLARQSTREASPPSADRDESV